MASNDPDKLNRYQPYDPQRPWPGQVRGPEELPAGAARLEAAFVVKELSAYRASQQDVHTVMVQ